MPHQGGNIIPVSISSSSSIAGNLTVHVTKKIYPSIPTNFEINPDVETLWQRYETYKAGREQLLSMGYFCLSFLENISNGRYYIENIFQIKREVIDKLGDLTSARGDYLSARKGKGHNFQPITENEKKWIEKCILLIFLRVGEYQKDKTSLALIDLSSLPSLI